MVNKPSRSEKGKRRPESLRLYSDFLLLAGGEESVKVNLYAFLLFLLLTFLPSGVVPRGLLRRLGEALFSRLRLVIPCLIDGYREISVDKLYLGRSMSPCVPPFGNLPETEEEIAGHEQVLALLAV